MKMNRAQRRANQSKKKSQYRGLAKGTDNGRLNIKNIRGKKL